VRGKSPRRGLRQDAINNKQSLIAQAVNEVKKNIGGRTRAFPPNYFALK